MDDQCILKAATSPWLKNNFPHVKTIIDRGTKITIPNGTILLSPGELSHHLYYILKGTMKISLVNYDGQERIISIMSSNTLVSEGLPGQENVSPVLVVAIEDCELVKFNKEQIQNIIAQDPSITIDLINFFNLKYKMITSLYHGLLFCSPPQRLCRLLCILGDNFGQLIEQDKKLINLRITQNRLADLLGVSRVTIANILKELRQAEIVETKGKKIIYNKKLCQYCQSN